MNKKREKTARGSYTIPQSEERLLNHLLKNFTEVNPRLNKSEVIRVGIYEVSKKTEFEIAEILIKNLGRLPIGKPKNLLSENELTNSEIIVNEAQWEEISKLFPDLLEANREGRPKINYRQTIDGILYIFRYKVQRRNIPDIYGSFATCRRRMAEWRKDSKWEEICKILLNKVTNENYKKELESILLRTLLIETQKSK